MALINSKRLEKIEKEKYRVHKEVEATYSIFEEDNKRYYQIDTYGSDDRKMTGKISQSIQMSETTLKSIIKQMGIEYGK